MSCSFYLVRIGIGTPLLFLHLPLGEVCVFSARVVLVHFIRPRLLVKTVVQKPPVQTIYL